MKHLERAFAGNHMFILYIAIILIVFILQSILGLIAIVAGTLLQGEAIGNILLEAKGVIALWDKNVLLVTLMIPMAISLGILVVAIKWIHGLSFSEVVNGTKSIRWNRVLSGFIVWLMLMSITTIIQYFIFPEDFTLQFNLSKFIPLFIISLLLIPLQTTFEEVLVRGYFAQGIGTLTKNRWCALILPALFFSLLHIANPEIKEHGLWIMLANYFAMSLVFGLTSILDDGIEIPMGVHAANNIFISLFTSQHGAAFETYAIFQINRTDPYESLAGLTIIGGIAIAIFYKKYKWSFGTLNKKIEKPEEAPLSVS